MRKINLKIYKYIKIALLKIYKYIKTKITKN